MKGAQEQASLAAIHRPRTTVIDLHRIREAPEEAVRALEVRGVANASEQVDELVTLDIEWRKALGEVNDLKARRNQISKAVGELKRAGESADDLLKEGGEVGARIGVLDQSVGDLDAKIREALLGLPNFPLPEVQPGDEDANELLWSHGEPKAFDFEPQTHWDLGEALGILDLASGSKISGSGFPVLRGSGARLQRVLIDFMLDTHTEEHGYLELRVPYLVTSQTMTGTGQLPKFTEESYQTKRDGLWLIPTAEVPVTNLHADEILPADTLPVRYTAYTPCFRREAGAAGKDTRGLLRVHQFDKVELVRYESAERSREALDELTREACRVLELLGLTFRVVRLAGGDLGAASQLTFDIEVWAPGVQRWLEVSSCSTFGDYQARRANLRYRPKPGAKPEFVHTLNGSALALPRLMVAIMETYQDGDGQVAIPEVLRERFGGSQL